MLNGVMLVWFIFAAISVVFVVWDSITNAPTSWIQRMAWILVVVYTGVVGLILYLLTCRRPFPGGHDAFTRATWKQSVNSEMHCLAGDATGIVIAASIVPFFGLTNGWDATIEYIAGFICGLFIFQALMMLGMYQGKYLRAVRKTFFAETVSMNIVMGGMIPTMLILASLWPESEDPSKATFWFRMSLASIVGGVIAYPINYWLVKNHLKHGCMTLPGKDGPAPCLGFCSPEANHDANIKPTVPMSTPSTQPGHEGHGMIMRSLPIALSCIWIVGTFLFLLLAILVANHFVPLKF
ncbi:DUF4396 domain-containing protein [Microbulbifer sp. CnH-101-G]|uniref:DUF4396 domain-containing protein n=1 Tax=Microbulbifer sp. CnH-101-G TaxID=3243393 RepID=UPI00403981C0